MTVELNDVVYEVEKSDGMYTIYANNRLSGIVTTYEGVPGAPWKRINKGYANDFPPNDTFELLDAVIEDFEANHS